MEIIASPFSSSSSGGGDFCLDTFGSVEAVHVHDFIIRTVKVIDGKKAVAGRLFGVAFAFHILVQPIRYQRMMPCIINHSLCIRFIIHCCVPNLRAFIIMITLSFI
jgi:hypothetical protein